MSEREREYLCVCVCVCVCVCLYQGKCQPEQTLLSAVK